MADDPVEMVQGVPAEMVEEMQRISTEVERYSYNIQREMFHTMDAMAANSPGHLQRFTAMMIYATAAGFVVRQHQLEPITDEAVGAWVEAMAGHLRRGFVEALVAREGG